MKTSISIPDPVFLAAERISKRLQMSRSLLYATAVAEFLKQHDVGDEITRKLNEVYGATSETMDPVLAELQHASIQPNSW